MGVAGSKRRRYISERVDEGFSAAVSSSGAGKTRPQENEDGRLYEKQHPDTGTAEKIESELKTGQTVVNNTKDSGTLVIGGSSRTKVEKAPFIDATIGQLENVKSSNSKILHEETGMIVDIKEFASDDIVPPVKGSKMCPVKSLESLNGDYDPRASTKDLGKANALCGFSSDEDSSSCGSNYSIDCTDWCESTEEPESPTKEPEEASKCTKNSTIDYTNSSSDSEQSDEEVTSLEACEVEEWCAKIPADLEKIVNPVNQRVEATRIGSRIQRPALQHENPKLSISSIGVGPSRFAPLQQPLTGNINQTKIRETNEVKKKKAGLPTRNLPHPTPKFGDWLNSRRMVNNYIILESLGSGSYAEVKLCKEKASGRLYAMKFINRNSMKTGLGKTNHFEDIKREIEIMKKLNHPNVLRLYEVMDDPKENKLFLVLEYMRQGDLLTLQKKKSKDKNNCEPMDDDELQCVLLQVLLGLSYLHEQRCVHGDVKPQNLLVGTNGIVKIADFGISQQLGKSKQKLMDTAGTPAFMSPEMCSGEEYSGQKADIYAVGATIFMLKFGRPPFVAKTALQMFDKIQNEPLAFPHSIDAGLQQLLEKMLLKDPEKRITLSQAMQHPWVTKQIKGVQPFAPVPDARAFVGSDIGPLTNRNRFAIDANIRVQMSSRLKGTRNRMLNTVSDNSPGNPNLSEKTFTKSINRASVSTESEEVFHGTISKAETMYRSAVFARKKFEQQSSDSKVESDWSSSSDEESVVCEDDQTLMTALCIPGFEHTSFLETPQFSAYVRKCPEIISKLSIEVGHVSVQGRRSTQEDRYIVIPELENGALEYETCYVGVYDGHGGVESSNALVQRLHSEIFSHPVFPNDIPAAFKDACKNLDSEICSFLQSEGSMSGSTATFAIFRKLRSSGKLPTLWIGHIGDCRAVMSNVNAPCRVLTCDHRPQVDAETERVVSQGGKIVNGRVNGVLAVTRAFGDLEFKGMEQRQLVDFPSESNFAKEKVGTLITAHPDIIKVELVPNDEFIVMACDGLWDVMENEEVMSFCRSRLSIHANAQLAANELAEEAIKRFSHDNVTVVLVKLNLQNSLSGQ